LGGSARAASTVQHSGATASNRRHVAENETQQQNHHRWGCCSLLCRLWARGCCSVPPRPLHTQPTNTPLRQRPTPTWKTGKHNMSGGPPSHSKQTRRTCCGTGPAVVQGWPPQLGEGLETGCHDPQTSLGLSLASLQTRRQTVEAPNLLYSGKGGPDCVARHQAQRDCAVHPPGINRSRSQSTSTVQPSMTSPFPRRKAFSNPRSDSNSMNA